MNPYEPPTEPPIRKTRRPLTPAQWFMVIVAVVIVVRLINVALGLIMSTW